MLLDWDVALDEIRMRWNSDRSNMIDRGERNNPVHPRPKGSFLDDGAGLHRERPELERLVAAAGGEGPAIGREGHGEDQFLVPFESHHLPPCRGLPENHVTLVVAAGEELPVGGERQ